MFGGAQSAPVSKVVDFYVFGISELSVSFNLEMLKNLFMFLFGLVRMNFESLI